MRERTDTMTTELRHELDDGVEGSAQLEQVVPPLGALVAKVRPDDLRGPTPCAGWTTRDLLNHIVGGADMFADAFAGAQLRDISGRLPDAIGNDPGAAFGAAAGRFVEGTNLPGAMERVLPLPFGAMTGRTFLRFVAFDLMIHTWDLATTLGEDPDIGDDIVGEIDGFARRVLDAAPRDGVNFGPPAQAPASASRLEQLVAFTGRDPAWRPSAPA
jgi:uncharacterized protein (TIGR03086 family)